MMYGQCHRGVPVQCSSVAEKPSRTALEWKQMGLSSMIGYIAKCSHAHYLRPKCSATDDEWDL